MGTVAGGGRPTVTDRKGSAGTALHVAVQGQEAGCNLPVNGKSGGVGSFRLSGCNGSNYPGSPSRDRTTSPLCTRPVAIGSCGLTKSDRPSRVDNRNSPPVKMRARSRIDEPSVAANGYTVFESMSPSADQPKLLTTPVQGSSARGVIGRGERKHGRVWCYPGKGTPSVPRTAAPPTAVRDALVGSCEVLNLATRVKRDRVPSVRRLSSIVEKQCELTPDEEAGTVSASDSNSIVIDADKASATGNTSPSAGCRSSAPDKYRWNRCRGSCLLNTIRT